MTEAVRQQLVFSVLEELLEPEERTVVLVWSAAQPLSGDEFEEVRVALLPPGTLLLHTQSAPSDCVMLRCAPA